MNNIKNMYFYYNTNVIIIAISLKAMQTKLLEGGFRLEKTLIDRLKEAKKEYETEFVCFFNDGKVRTDEKFSAKRIREFKSFDEFEAIEDVLCKATESYARNFDFDNIDMHLLLGLIFNREDVDDNNQVKAGSNPIPNIVRYYTGNIDSSLDGKKTNIWDYTGFGRQSFISFNQLIALIQNSGLDYTGPESFEEFKQRILAGETFDILLSADLKPKENVDTNTNEFTK